MASDEDPDVSYELEDEDIEERSIASYKAASQKPSTPLARNSVGSGAEGEGDYEEAVASDDDEKSVALSEAVSDQSSKARSHAPSQRGPSVSRGLGSEANFGASVTADDDNASIAFSAVASEKPSSHRPSGRGPSATGAGVSNSNLGESALDASVDGDSASVALSATASDLPGRSHPQAPAPRRSSGMGGGGGGRLGSEANFGASADDDGNASVAFSAAASERPSKRSFQAPHATAAGASGSRLGDSAAAGDDDNASVAFSDVVSERSSRLRSAVASQRAAPSAGGDRASGGGGGGSRGSSRAGYTEPLPWSEAGGQSAHPSGLSGLSYDVDADDGASEPRRPGQSPLPPRSQSSLSHRSQRAPTQAASSAAFEEEAVESGEVMGATGSLSQSGLDEPVESASSRSSSRAAPAKRPTANSSVVSAAAPAAALAAAPAASGASVRSSRSAVPSSYAVPAARASVGTYSGSVLEEDEIGPDDSVSVVHARRASPAPSARPQSASRGTPASASATSRRPSAGTNATPSPAPAAVAASAAALAAESQARSARPLSGDRPSHSGAPSRASSSKGSVPQARSPRYSFDDASAHGPYGYGYDGAASMDRELDDPRVADSGSVFRGAPSITGSIIQAPPGGGEATPASRRSGGPVFKRMPADSPDSPAATTRNASLRSSSRTPLDDTPEAGGPTADGWHDGAIRVPPPGVPRPYSARRGLPDPHGSPAEAGSPGNSFYQPSGAARGRPSSAAPRDRQGAQLAALVRKHPATWDGLDVAAWVEFLGLGQYRRRFLHHAVDGRLLLRLTDAQLKAELGIGPMGHRRALLDAAAQLVRSFQEAERDRSMAAAARGQDDEDGDEGAGAAPHARHGGRPSSAPRAGPRPRPASAAPGLGGAPPPRRPASASRGVLPPDSHLGPAGGRTTVYEQRARLLFELDRAQARAEQHRALVDQLQHTAALSTEEVGHIRGLLSDIEKKNRAAFGGGGAMDSGARIPWRHVGPGTKHNNWYPERFARPGEPETADLTFQPVISPESRRLMAGEYGDAPPGSAVNSFLDRLDNDLRKREGTRKELERKYYAQLPGGAPPPGAPDTDRALVSDALQARCHMRLGREPADYEVQIDEALDKLSTSESWREAGLRDGPIRAAKGAAKLAAAASALRSLAFMERYRADLKSKGGKAKALEKKWTTQTLGTAHLPGAKDGEDGEQAAALLALLGWRDADGQPSEAAVSDDLLDRLLDRAIEYRSRYDSWWERARSQPEERAAGFRCEVNWAAEPRWAGDGLGQLMEAELARQARAGQADAAGAGGGSADYVDFTVRLLGKSRMDDLRRLKTLAGRPKRLAVYRAIRTQKFLEYTQADLEERDRKMRQAYSALAPPKRVLQPSRIEGFFDRLREDAGRRRAAREKAQQAQDKLAKEAEILASSVMYGKSRGHR